MKVASEILAPPTNYICFCVFQMFFNFFVDFCSLFDSVFHFCPFFQFFLAFIFMCSFFWSRFFTFLFFLRFVTFGQAEGFFLFFIGASKKEKEKQNEKKRKQKKQQQETWKATQASVTSGTVSRDTDQPQFSSL